MNYYYDIDLNFLKNNYYFLEWDKDDIILHLKKIPLFKIDFKTYLDLYNYNIIMDKSFLEKIENKTVKQDDEKIKYASLFCDGSNVIALNFDENGNTLLRSSLSFEEDASVCEIIYTLKKISLVYEKKEKLKKTTLRIYDEIKNTLKNEFDYLSTQKNYIKIKYLYNEWFNREEENIDKIINDIKLKLNNDITEKELKIYNIIKMSYKKV